MITDDLMSKWSVCVVGSNIECTDRQQLTYRCFVVADIVGQTKRTQIELAALAVDGNTFNLRHMSDSATTVTI